MKVLVYGYGWSGQSVFRLLQDLEIVAKVVDDGLDLDFTEDSRYISYAQMLQDEVLLLFNRSSNPTKKNLVLINGVGVIDEDYRGPVIACLYNDSNEARTIKGGDRIAQLIVIPYLPVIFEETDSLDATERNDSGFGSTGI